MRKKIQKKKENNVYTKQSKKDVNKSKQNNKTLCTSFSKRLYSILILLFMPYGTKVTDILNLQKAYIEFKKAT